MGSAFHPVWFCQPQAMGGVAWLDKHNELQRNLEEIVVDVQEVQRLKRGGKNSFGTLKRMLSSLPLTPHEKRKRESMLADTMSAMNRLKNQTLMGSDAASVNNMPGGQAAAQPSSKGGVAQQMLMEQQDMMSSQDASMDLLLASVTRQKEMGEAIGEELDQQSGLLDDLENGMDTTGMVLGRQQARVEGVLEQAGKGGTMCIIIALSALLAILTMLALDII